MTWKELHIAFELCVNQLNATSDRGFQREEIDVYLNQALDTLLNATIKGDRVKLIESIDTSSVALAELNGLIQTINLPIEKEGIQFKAVLPSFLYSHISGSAGITCTNPIERYTKTVKTANVKLPIIEQGKYKPVRIVINYTIGDTPQIEVINLLQYQIKEKDKFELINLIKSSISSVFNIAWENDYSSYVSNRLRLWAVDEQVVAITTIVLYDNAGLVIDDTETTFTIKTKDYSLAPSTRDIKLAFVGSENFGVLSGNTIYSKSSNILLCTLQNNSLVIGNTHFCVPVKVSLVYYKQPIRISSTFDQNLRVSSIDAVNRKVGDKIARLAALIATNNTQRGNENNIVLTN